MGHCTGWPSSGNERMMEKFSATKPCPICKRRGFSATHGMDQCAILFEQAQQAREVLELQRRLRTLKHGLQDRAQSCRVPRGRGHLHRHRRRELRQPKPSRERSRGTAPPSGAMSRPTRAVSGGKCEQRVSYDHARAETLFQSLPISTAACRASVSGNGETVRSGDTCPEKAFSSQCVL